MPLFGQYNLVGSASSAMGSCIQLTQATPNQNGSMWSTSTISLYQDFDFNYEVFVGSNDAGADGMVFMLSVDSTGTGTGGGGIGYEGIQNTLGIEIDTWNNVNYGDIPADHLAIISNGVADHNAPTGLSAPVQASSTSTNIEDNQTHTFRVTWDASASTLKVYFDCVLRITYTGNIVANQLNGNTNVYYGFTSSTGGATNIHRVCPFVPNPGLQVTQTLCSGDTLNAQAPSFATGSTYVWSTGSDIIPMGNSALLFPANTSTYYVTVTQPCSTVVDTVVVQTFSQYNPTFNLIDTLCKGSNPVNATALVAGGVYSGAGIIDSVLGVFDPHVAGSGNHPITYTISGNCGADTTLLVHVPADPEILNNAPNPLCNADTVLFTASIPGGVWSGAGTLNAQTGSHSWKGMPAGNYPVYYTTTSPCNAIDTAFVDVLDGLQPSVMSSPSFCSGDTIQLNGMVNAPGQVGVDYSMWWSGFGVLDSSGLYAVPSGASGNFNAVFTASALDGSCPEVVVEVVSVLPLSSSEFTPTRFCDNDFSQQSLIAVNPNGLWNVSPISGSLNTLNPGGFIPKNLGSGSWQVNYTLSDQVAPNGCGSSFTDTVVVSASPVSPIVSSATVCEGDTVVLTAQSSSSSVKWYNATQASVVMHEGLNFKVPKSLVKAPGLELLVQSFVGYCGSDFDTAVITVNPIPKPYVVQLGDTFEVPADVLLEGSAGVTGTFFYNWNVDGSTGNDSLFEVQVEEARTLILPVSFTVSSDFGCEAGVSGKIFTKPAEIRVFIPNAFKPDGDGVNDTFYPVFQEYVVFNRYVFSVFNKWGEQVFYTQNQSDSWNGLIDGEYAPADLYTYKILYGTGGQESMETFIGKVQLLR